MFSLIPALLLLVIAAALLEVVLRARYESTEKITGAAEWRVADFGGFSYHWDRYHPLLGWTNQPGYRSDGTVPFTVTINSLGLRATRDYAPVAANGVRRIALFGDSLAFGEEVDDGETVADHLGELRPDLEVLNYGVHGYSLGQSVLLLEEEGGLLEPDHYVVMVLFPEDLVRDSASEFVHAKPVFRLVDGSLKVENVPVPEASRTPRLLRISYAAAWLFGRRGSWHRSTTNWASDLARSRAIVGRAASVCAERDRPLTVVVLLAPAGVLGYLSDPEWRELFNSKRAEFLDQPVDMLDLVPAQIEAYREERAALFAPLAHWSSRGNQIWAEHIARHLAGE
ncbi:MAG: hypothetical protein QNL88_14160 [Acidobacteriota bacterium]|nr:hypothetical protein [Acidobacteriota bacterium]